MHSKTTDSEHILICSSNPELALNTGKYLSGTEALLVASRSAEEARKYIELEQVSAIIIDLFLIDTDGISFARELREEMPWLPIIVISTAQTTIGYSDRSPTSMNTRENMRMEFALKQASINSTTNALNILHVENNDESAELIKGILGVNTGLFRARSVLEAKIALSVRSYDFALINSNHPLFYPSNESNSLLEIMGQLRTSPPENNPVYLS